MAEPTTLIRGPFGSERVPVPGVPEAGTRVAGSVRPETARVPLNDDVVAQDPGFAQARATRVEAALRPESTVLEAVGAAIDTWDTTRLLKRIARPNFDESGEGWNVHEALNELPMRLSADEREFIVGMALGPKSWKYAVEQVENLRTAQQALGNHPVVGGAATFLDPLWLAVPPSVRLGKASPMAGRAVSAVSAAGMAGAVTAAKEGPVSDYEIATSLLMNGAVGGVLYRSGKLVPEHPDFPADALNRTIPGQGGTVPQASQEFNTGTGLGDNLTRPLVTPGGAPGTAVSYAGGHSGNEYGGKAVRPDNSVTWLANPSNLTETSEAVRLGRTGVQKDAKAVYLPGEDRVYLFRDNIKPEDDVQGIILHEVGVHMKAERVLGTKALGEMLDEIEARAARGEARAKAAWDSVPSDTPLHLQREEALGYYIEQNHGKVRDGIVSRLVFAAKEFLRKHGVTLQLTDADIVQRIRKAARTEVDSFDAVFPYVWHGSPVRGIDQLELKYAGTGEGASAFGYGHYVTSEKGTALDYRNKESVRRGIPTEQGGLYKLKINAKPEDFLDLEAAEQSPKVAAALERLGVSGKNGKAVYDELTKRLGSQKAASEALLAEGVQGNRYSTGRTRGSSRPSSNYVLFSDAALDMTARYSKPATDPKKVAAQAEARLEADAKKRGVGQQIMWNMHKTMSGFGEVGQKVANLLYDNNADLSHTSVEAHQVAISHELRAPLLEYGDMLRAEMGARGAGLLQMLNPFTSRKAHAVQGEIEREVHRELLRREQMAQQGLSALADTSKASEAVSKMADKIDELHKLALAEQKRSGVQGAEVLDEKPGYLHRKWSSYQMDAAMDKMEALGLTRDEARKKLNELVGYAVGRANARMSPELAKKVGSSIVDRAMSKGYFEDGVFSATDSHTLGQLRDELKASGMSHADIESALDILKVKNDEQGKAGFLKHRMDLDYNASIRIGDDTVSVMDLIDGSVHTIVDTYVAQVSTNSALARAGLPARSDIEALRKELLHSIKDEGKRREAAELFDNTLAHMRGQANGARLNQNFRMMQAFGRTISLAWSGLWQATEYANIAGQYGLAKTLKFASQQIPGFKQLVENPSRADARSLNNVLAEHSSQSLRLRPYLAKFEDGYEMDTTSAMQLSLQAAGPLVPIANAMKYVHHAQAKLVGNLILDRLEMAANGNAKARQALADFGLESHVMDKLAAEIKVHGFNVDAWSDAVWDATRPAFAKMMDAAVLRSRLGDVPAFAAFDPVGKMAFTYRTFVLTAHNKVLAGMLERNGATAVGLVLLYQFPLALAAVQAQSVIMGKGPLSEQDLTKKALGQMGGLGLFSEPLKWATGESNSIGAPVFIPLDRGIKLGQSVLGGDPGNVGSAAMSVMPVVIANPFIKSMATQIKEN